MVDALDAGRTVLTPSAELAATVFAAVERAHREAGREVWPTPRIRDLTGWLRELHLRRQLQDPTLARCLSDTEERELWREVVDETGVGQDVLDPAGAARAARRASRALFD